MGGLITRPSKNVRICKLDDEKFVQELTRNGKHDIVCLMETHIGEDEFWHMELNGYYSIPKCREKQSNGVYYGGLCLFMKAGLKKGVTVVEKKSETEYIWVKLNKEFFNMEHSVYICFAYARPKETSGKFGVDSLDRIEKDMSVFSKIGKCIIMGDLNKCPHKRGE